MTDAPTTSPLRRWSAVAAGLAVLLAWALARAAVRPPPPRPEAAPAAQFSALRARAALGRVLAGEVPHPVGSAEHARVRERLLGELGALGLEPEVQDALVLGRNGVVVRVRNVLARLEGRASGPALALVAHYDSVAAGPGAADDGAGVATLLECARALRAAGGPEHPLVLAFTDGEEVALAGARAFLREHRFAREVASVVNVEARGTCGVAYLFQTGPGMGAALARFAELAPRPCTTSFASLVYARMPNDTDFTEFLAAGRSGFNLAFVDGLARYHTPKDDLAHLDLASLQHLGESALAAVRALDAAGPARQGGELAWHDVLGRGVLRWPAAWSAPLALACLASLVLFARRRGLAPRAIARGALTPLLGAAFGGAATWAAAAALGLVADGPAPWVGHPARWDALAAALGAAGGFLAAQPPGRSRPGRPDPLCVFLGMSLLTALGALLVALAEPAAAPLLLVPAAAAAAGVWIAGSGPSGLHAAVLATFAAAALLGQPVIQGLELAVGFQLGALPGALVGALTALVAPLCQRQGRMLAALAGLVGLGVGAWIGSTPAATADAPAWCNVVHVQDGESARWCVQAFGAEVPFPSDVVWHGPERPVPWSRLPGPGWIGGAPRHAEAPPELTVVATEPAGQGRTVRVRASSPRGAGTLVLGLPRGVQLTHVRAGALELALDGEPRGGLRGVVPLVGVEPDGVELTLRIPGPEPVQVELLDLRPGLPEELRGLADRRPSEVVPRSVGDATVVVARAAL